jgi:hypothetical protein
MATCPDPKLNEGPTDCPWAEMTRKIIDENKSCEAVIKKSAPFLLAQLKKDSEHPEFLEQWGQAKNFDEGAKGIIVDKKILQCLADKLKLKNAIEEKPEFNVIHAGLQHTYGYLFSNLITRFGYKRDRWTKDDIKTGLGLDTPLLNENRAGSLLANVTFLFAKFTFGTEGLADKAVAKDITGLDTKNFSVRHLRETLADKSFAIHTTFVKFNAANSGSKNTHLLIYWIENLKSKSHYFISGFPVDDTTVEKAFEPSSLGENKPLSTRYNAWVPGVTDSESLLTGTREELKN